MFQVPAIPSSAWLPSVLSPTRRPMLLAAISNLAGGQVCEKAGVVPVDSARVAGGMSRTTLKVHSNDWYGCFVKNGIFAHQIRHGSHRGIAQPGSARRSGRRGRGFKSRYPDHECRNAQLDRELRHFSLFFFSSKAVTLWLSGYYYL